MISVRDVSSEITLGTLNKVRPRLFSFIDSVGLYQDIKHIPQGRVRIRVTRLTDVSTSLDNSVRRDIREGLL